MEHLIIENRIGKVKLDDTVTKSSMDLLIDKLATLYGDDAVRNHAVIGEMEAVAAKALQTVEVVINSPGGSVKQGYRAYKTLMAMKARGVRVVAVIEKQAASMGSVIAMAADEIRIEENAKMMIHDVSVMDYGNAEQLRKSADVLDEVSNAIADIYSSKTNLAPVAVRALMKSETWMTAADAVSMNFADTIYKGEIIEPPKSILDKLLVDIAASDGTPAGMSLLDRLISPSDTEAKDRISALENVIAGHDAALVELQGKLDTAEGALQEASEIQALNIDLQAKVEKIPGLEAKIAELTEANLVTSAKVDSAAAQKLASLGHGDPLNLSNGNVTKPNEGDILAQFEAIKDPTESIAFFNANKDALKLASMKTGK